jgi:hypothetical protein
MTPTARLLLPLAVISFFAGCRHAVPSLPPLPADALAPSPRLIIGRIIAVDLAQKFAFVELASDSPAAALTDGTELIARTLELRETARLRASRYVRGRTLGTRIIGGQPSPGDEVVWLAP